MKVKKLSFRLLASVIILLGATIQFGFTGVAGPATPEGPGPEANLPDGAFVSRVYYNEVADLERLARYDLWEFNNIAERYVLVSMDRGIYRELQQAGWRLSVDDEATAMLTPAAGNQIFGAPDTFNGGYRTVDELYADLVSINAANPTLTELVDYGDGFCKANGGCTTPGGDLIPGDDLLAMRVTNEASLASKPVFFLMAGIHAREITTPELAMRMLDWLVEGYGTNPDATWIVDHHQVWIVPTVNPEGHRLVVMGTQPPYNDGAWFQRKNANPSNGCSTWPPNSFSQYGIDLNRNHSFLWNTGGSSSLPCDQTYRGPSAASEFEVSQLQDLVLSLIPDQRGPGMNDPAPLNTTGLLITMHSYSELVLWPWGTTTDPAPNKAGLMAIGDKFATYNGYTSCQPSICLYETSGTSDEWAYGVLGIPSFTFEVGTQFMPSYGEVDSVQWPDNGPALQYAAKIARTPYRLINGPDALNVTATDNGDETFTLTAVINDTMNGGQPIRRATYYVDVPYWEGGTPARMAASDGSYNSPVEAVQAIVDVSTLPPGQHIIFVHGRDNVPNLGPAGAVFITVP